MGRKEEILDALINILTNKGINSNFTMKELAEKVNIGKSTIYEYFPTKEELVHQAILRIVENGVKQVFREDVNSKTSFEEAFKTELTYLYGVALSSAHIINIITPGIQNRIPGDVKDDIVCNVKSARDEYEKRFSKIFAKAFEEGLITLEEIEVKTFVITSLVVGSIIRMANTEAEINTSFIDKYVNKIYDTVLKIGI